MLANSVKHLLTFVTGRRKAIEVRNNFYYNTLRDLINQPLPQWGRARAIHEAYAQSLAESPQPELAALSVADVYSWLAENGHFPRPNQGPVHSISQQSAKIPNDTHTNNEDEEPIWCRFCGLNISLHGSNSYLPKKDEHPTESFEAKATLQVSECPIVVPGLQITKLPRIDVKQFILPDQIVARGINIPFDRRILLAAADPSMVQCIRKLTKQWKLNTFHGNTSNEQPYPIEDHTSAMFPLEKFGRNHQQVETHLAPHALVSLLTKQLIRALVSRGLDVSNRDKTKAVSYIPSRRRKTQVIDSMRMLTPTHILSGLLTRGQGGEAKRHPVDAYLLFGLSRLGAVVGDDHDEGREKESKIKMEDGT